MTEPTASQSRIIKVGGGTLKSEAATTTWPTTKPPIDLEAADGANWIIRLAREFSMAVDRGDLAEASALIHNIQIAARHVEVYITGRLGEGG